MYSLRLALVLPHPTMKANWPAKESTDPIGGRGTGVMVLTDDANLMMAISLAYEYISIKSMDDWSLFKHYVS